MSEIKDFGQKIGNAKKDFYKKNIEEKNYILEKSDVWEKPIYSELVNSGIDILVVYFYKKIRDSLPNNALQGTNKKDQELKNLEYKKFINDIKKEVLKCKTTKDVINFYEKVLLNKGYIERTSKKNIVKFTDKSNGLMNDKLLKNSQVCEGTLARYKLQIRKQNFCATPEQKILNKYFIIKYESKINKDTYIAKMDFGTITLKLSKNEIESFKKMNKDTFFIVNEKSELINYNFKDISSAEKYLLDLNKDILSPKKKKKSFKINILEKLERKSHIKREKENIEGQDFINIFKIKGGEFGNYLNDKQRQDSLNYAYDAFKDLAYILNIDDSSIGLNNRLSIAFGARGSGTALAHYEQDREVINLTKLKGAGSLAHEYFHALDNLLYKEYYKDIYEINEMNFNQKEYIEKEFLTNDNSLTFKTVKNLIDTIKYKDGKETEFYKEATKLNDSYSKLGQGYWNSNIEISARAFECYIFDKLKEQNMQNDYLVSFTYTNEDSLAYPKGEERENINKAFDLFFKELKDEQFLKEKEEV